MDILEIIHDGSEPAIAQHHKKPFECPEATCGKAFNRKSDLQRHHRIHTNERPYVCNYPTSEGVMCGKSFIQRSALTVHIRTHTGEKPHRCQYTGCGKKFSDSSSLARHRRIHTGKRPYMCSMDGCDRRKTTLTKHAKTQHNRPEVDESKHDVSEEEDMKPAMPKVQPHTNRIAKPIASQLPSSRGAFGDSYNMGYPTMHYPPTPPHYDDHRSVSPTTVTHRDEEHPSSRTPVPTSHPMMTPTASSFGPENGLRIDLDPPTHHQLLASAQSMQNSPGSLSSCSSASTTRVGTDYFYGAPQRSPHYQLSPHVHPVSPGTVPQYHPGPVRYAPPQQQQLPQVMPVHSTPPQIWYENNANQYQLLNSAYPLQSQADMPYVKNELPEYREQQWLPTPRSSFNSFQ